MKNIIYGLGQHFWHNLEFISSILKDTIALCDADKTKFEYAAALNKTMVTPEQLNGVIAITEESYIYISTTDFYEEVFDMLTQKLKIPPEKIGLLPIPDISPELRNISRNYFIESYGGKNLPIKSMAFDSAILLPDRSDALKYMPKHGIITEVGVAYGDFSRKIIDILSPKKFYAIDYFSQNDPFFSLWGRDDCARDNMPHQQWYENRFKPEIENGLMETRQGKSWDCLSQFPDDYFDYVYLDAGHDYKSVMKDIDVLKCKVKNCGFIQFNDYCIGPAFSTPYGVINAVNSFVNSGHHKIKYFCLNTEPQHIGFPDIVVQIQKTSGN
ncbi:MAG: class I SAM-dependent methyltransferase [Holophagales bacterium]|jgi:hypothetical protein|nr:class I SAM-dependent methyltransferase [Holophagales bacterium]